MDHIIDIEHLLNLLETEPTVQEKEDAEQLRLRDGGVRFEDVCFAHDSRQSIIKHMSFEAKAGSKVAIVGSTGAGKSTVLKLLLRVRDVGQGSIKIDGQDIRDVTIQSLRDQVAVVPQVGTWTPNLVPMLTANRIRRCSTSLSCTTSGMEGLMPRMTVGPHGGVCTQDLN